jgi:aspartate carbamoyltransferase catalytic subunit
MFGVLQLFPMSAKNLKRAKNTETFLLEKVMFEVFSMLSARTRSFFVKAYLKNHLNFRFGLVKFFASI